MLGYISRNIHSRWFVEPLFNNRAAFGKSFEDAKHWMIAHNCIQVSVITGQQTRQLYVHSKDPSLLLPHAVTGTIDMNRSQEFELNFWDEKHDLQPGQQVTIIQNLDEGSEVGDHLGGAISRVERHKVWVLGQKWFDLVK